MKRTLTLITVVLMTGGVASAALVVTDGLMQGQNDARIGGIGTASGNTSSGPKDATLAGTSMNLVVPQASRSQGATPATTCDSRAAGSYVTDLAGTTFTTTSWAKGVANNIGLTHASGHRKNFSYYPPGPTVAEHDYLTSYAYGGVDSWMTFTVNTLSSYSWSALLSGTGLGNTGDHSANGGNGYFNLWDDINKKLIFNFETSTPDALSGSGQLSPGNYILAWGAYVNSISENRAAPNSAITGDQFGSLEHSLSGTLTISAVPEPSTYIAGALMLVPFGVGMIRKLRANRTA